MQSSFGFENSGIRKIVLVLMILAAIAGGVYGYKSRAEQPTVTLSATDSKFIIEAASVALQANQKLENVLEIVCKQNNLDRSKVDVKPNPKDNSLIDLVPKEEKK